MISRTTLLCALGSLGMSYGWGFRGDYGHEAGAMVPGALLGLGVCLASGRSDWWRRFAAFGFLGALGWAFGGQMSYGIIPSYTISHSFPDVAYGYSCLFLVGALWGGIGAALLSHALTVDRQSLERSVPPLAVFFLAIFLTPILLGTMPDLEARYDQFTEKVMRDTEWLQATLGLAVGIAFWLGSPKSRKTSALILLMAAGWWAGYLLLVHWGELRMSPTPPPRVRSDNWGGCVGMFIALLAYLAASRNRVGILLAFYGFIAGGVGFSVGDFINKADKVRWEPFYRHPWLQGFDHWKWTEQSFGLMMGFGMALGFARLLKAGVAPPSGEEEHRPVPGQFRFSDFAVVFLLVAMLGVNFRFNIGTWEDYGSLPPETDMLLGLLPRTWCGMVGILLACSVLFGIFRHRRGGIPLLPPTSFGRAQLLYLLILWSSLVAVYTKSLPSTWSHGLLFIHLTFWFSALVCTLIVLGLSGRAGLPAIQANRDSACLSLGWKEGLVGVLIPVLIVVLTSLTLAMHDAPGDGSRLRFGPNAHHLQTEP